MKKNFTVFVFYFAGLLNIQSQLHQIQIEVENIENNGTVYIAIYNDTKSFEKDNGDKKTYVKSIIEKVNTVRFIKKIDLEEGVYAISLFIDSNANKKLDTNLIGIPTEQYGFSNNAVGFLGKPTFKNASFKLIKDSKQIIKLK
jgi:uncharacterized protein (DUF2141 family)